mgnify:CR=1 FL=1
MSGTRPEGSPFARRRLLGLGLGARALMRGDVPENPFSRAYFAVFPSFFMLGSTGNNFSHTVYPIGPEKSRGVIRLYWIGDDETAGTRFAREYTTATTRDVHSEDISVIEAGQRGLSSGALEHIHFQEKEILCRHLIEVVKELHAAGDTPAIIFGFRSFSLVKVKFTPLDDISTPSRSNSACRV